MKSTKIKIHVSKQSIENEAFWNKHTEAQAASGISKSAYCHANKVNYPRFIYWSKKKVLTNVTGALVAVKVEPATDRLPSPTALCTLTLRSGNCLHIYDERVLPMILAGWS